MKERPPDVHFEFDHEPDAPRKARGALSPIFADADDGVADAVALIASELVSNVVMHTDDGGVMEVWNPHADLSVRLEVGDRDRALPDEPHDADNGGRGLRIVEDVADAWGVLPTEDGKVVWAELKRPAAD